MMREALELCRARWRSWFPDEPTPDLSVVVMPRSRVGDRAVAMLFTDDDPQPRLALKFAWSDSAMRGIRREALALQGLAGNFPDLSALAPRHLVTEQVRGGSVSVTTAVPGRRWRTPASRRSISRWSRHSLRPFAMAIDATACGRTSEEGEVPLTSLSPVAEWAASMRSAHGRTWRGIAELADSLASSDVSFRPRWQHGDLTTGNVLLGRGKALGLVDWEMAQEDLPPWFDCCYLVGAVAMEVGPDDRLVQKLVRDVVTPRWQAPFPMNAGLTATALMAAQRAHRLERGSENRWFEVAEGLWHLPVAARWGAG